MGKIYDYSNTHLKHFHNLIYYVYIVYIYFVNYVYIFIYYVYIVMILICFHFEGVKYLKDWFSQ